MKQNLLNKLVRSGRGAVRIYDSTMDDCRDCCSQLASIAIHES